MYDLQYILIDVKKILTFINFFFNALYSVQMHFVKVSSIGTATSIGTAIFSYFHS